MHRKTEIREARGMYWHEEIARYELLTLWKLSQHQRDLGAEEPTLGGITPQYLGGEKPIGNGRLSEVVGKSRLEDG
jgi:hypothetical protein